MYGYIYLIENLVNGKCYIGQHKAKEFDAEYLGSGRLIRNALEKYGKDNFQVTILDWCESLNELNEREAYWTNRCDAVNSKYFYNLRPGGNQAGTSEESRALISLHHADVSGENNPMYGVHRYGKDNPNYGNRGSKNPIFGRAVAKSTRDKLKIAKSKKVLCIELNREFNSLCDAAKFASCCVSQISLACNENSHVKTAGGYHWKKIEKEKEYEK